jgi:release factor family 10
MLSARQVESFIQLPEPLLTAYLNTRQADPSRHPPVPESFVWLKKEAKLVGHGLSRAEQGLLEHQLARIREFLDKRSPKERGLVLFAGAETWELVPLQVAVDDEIHWGKPAVSQLLWLVDEHKPSCVVVVDHKGASFFQYQLRELLKIAEKKFEIDISGWKKKDIGHIAGQEIQKTRGSQRNAFDHRMDAQYAHSCKETANQAIALSKEHNCTAIILIGEDRLSRLIKAAIPQDVRQHVITTQEDFAGLTDNELEKRLEPIIEEWERTHQAAIVSEFLDSDRGTVTGIEEVLFQLQKGGARKLLLTHDFNVDVRQCLKCGWTERTGDPLCSACGGEKRTVTLREVLPALAKLHKADIQIVSGDAANIMRKRGGMGAWLRGARLGVAR